MAPFARITYEYDGQRFSFIVETTEAGLQRLKSKLVWAKFNNVPVAIETTIELTNK